MALDDEKFRDRVWGYEACPTTRTVDNFVLALRMKLEIDPSRPVHVVTVRAYGYRLVAPEELMAAACQSLRRTRQG